ncbi:DLW-39 family protein [Rhodococcus antarcticus]|jgi:hypothetical protein|uniref:DLW-39 family protein n=1 Tax=Rhodococcus antarcticus TaxID=2987751 RepID=A0ABY6P0D0_9NOCA|nr:DLW-39 family protein [Rhodococcus antarcticus]UZJ24673.1 DLW-39 family protein [Rhodococcus antarcticus]
MKILLVLVAAAGAAFSISRRRGGRDEADLWHEATAPAAPSRSAAPPS